MTSTTRFVFLVIALIIGFWVLDVFIDLWLFPAGPLGHGLLHPPASEVFMRGLVCVWILIAAIIKRQTDRRQYRMNNTLAASEDLHRNLVKNCPDGIVVHRNNRVLYMNEVALGYLAAPNIESLGSRSINSFIHPDDLALTHQRPGAGLSKSQRTGPITIRLVLPNHEVRHAVVNSSLIVFEGAPAVLTFCHDITVDVDTRNDLVASQERLSLALEAAQDGVWDWDMAANRLIYNLAWTKMLGLDPFQGEHTPETWANLVHPDDKERVLAETKAHIRGETDIFEVEVRLRHADGHYIWVLDRGKVVEFAGDGTPLRMTGTHRNIDARKQAEIALGIRNRIAETFLTSQREGVFANILPLIGEAMESPVALLGIVDLNHRVQITSLDRGNKKADGGASDSLTRDALPEIFKETVDGGVATITNETLAVTLLPRPVARALTVPIVYKDRVLGFLMVADNKLEYEPADIIALGSLISYLAPILEFQMESEEKESQLRQAQKMEAIGALAGGIAHDFNNILQAILGFSTLALEEAQEQDSRHGGFIANDLERVVRATQRGRELVNRILLFSRRQEQEQQLVDLAEVIREAVELLANTIPATIEVQTELVTDCGMVLADPAQISQVIMNLATNGFHAMEAGGGRLTFTLRPVPADCGDPLVPDALANHDLVCLTVADTGAGMDASTLDRLYDPFFTTKDVGKGTGLGLSVVHGIVAAHSGEIVIESALKQGTAAHVFLPVLGELTSQALDEQAEAISLDSGLRVTTGSRILFLDDEFDITALGKALLEKHGHQVLALNDSLTALEHMRETPHGFDMLITDLTMPHMTGLQLAAEVSQIRPEMPVVLITGLNDKPIDEYQKNSQIQGVLRKPFDGSTLRDTVRRVLLDSAPS